MYGFRVDPMKWVQSGTGFEAAKCRTLVFDMAKKGDQGLIATGIDKILAQQQEDGSFGGDPPDELINKTGSAIVGCRDPASARLFHVLDHVQGRGC